MLCASASNERLRWREWPCPACSRGLTPFGYLVGRIDSGPKLRSGSIEEQIKVYSGWLKEWVEGCPHTVQIDRTLPKITEGSEHAVFFSEEEGVVYKLTLPDIYGDTYRIEQGAVFQDKSDPLEYLIRLRLWNKLFRPGPDCLGITERGQIVSRQKFILGTCPEQEEVDQFLETEAKLSPVKKSCWLWKRDYPELQLSVWVGDARADNFVKTPTEIIPIDLRLWLTTMK